MTNEERRSYIEDVAKLRGRDKAVLLMRDAMINKSKVRRGGER